LAVITNVKRHINVQYGNVSCLVPKCTNVAQDKNLNARTGVLKVLLKQGARLAIAGLVIVGVPKIKLHTLEEVLSEKTNLLLRPSLSR
jgi:hypothetical protein